MGVCGPLEGGRIGWEFVVHWKVGELGQFWGASGRLENWVCVWGPVEGCIKIIPPLAHVATPG